MARFSLLPLWLLLLALLAAPVLAQQKPYTNEGLIERNHGLAVGAHFHTGGLGADVYTYKKVSQNLQGFATFSFSSQRANKEIRIKSLYADQGGKDFIYDKKNHAYNLSLTLGVQRKLVALNSYNRLSVVAGVGLGPALGMLKPYYVEVAVPINATQARVELHPYDSERFGFADIVGRGDYFRGFNQLTLVPGLRLRAFATVNLAGSTFFVRAIHMGTTVDLFSSPMTIMDQQPDRSLFANLYLGFLLGNAW